MSKPLVSVIIPVYNCQLYIEKCICSLLSQEYEEIEIITVDDGSTDKSADVIKRIQNESSRIKYFYQDNSGPGRARNKAIQEAKGKYLLFVDADDYVSRDYIATLVECAEKNKAELTIGGYTLVYENKNVEKRVIPQKYERYISEEWAYRISSCWARLYLRDFWIQNRLAFHEERTARAEDVPIVLFTNAMAKNISIVKNAGYYYFQHQGSAMNNIKKKVIFGFPYQAFEEMYKKVKSSVMENSMEFFDFGILKFLAHFEFVIYRKADKTEKDKYHNFLYELLKSDFSLMVKNWKKIRRQVNLPLIHEIAIDLFIMKHKRNVTNR